MIAVGVGGRQGELRCGVPSRPSCSTSGTSTGGWLIAVTWIVRVSVVDRLPSLAPRTMPLNVPDWNRLGVQVSTPVTGSNVAPTGRLAAE